MKKKEKTKNKKTNKKVRKRRYIICLDHHFFGRSYV